MKPVIKFSHRPVRIGSDRIRIGGLVPGVSDVVEDPDGWVWALLQLLDGTRSSTEIATQMERQWPEVARAEIALALDDLARAGHLEDADEHAPASLSSAEQVRYSRSRALAQWMHGGPHTAAWAFQEALARASAVVLGMGGVGGTAALALVSSGVGRVHCVDRDTVALSDLNRQVLYTEADIGQPKVDVATRELRAHNSAVSVSGELLDIRGPGALPRFADAFDVVVLAADEPAAIRSWVNAACFRAGTPWVLGGYHGPLAAVGVFRPGTGPCFECARLAEAERVASGPPRTEWGPSIGRSAPSAANAPSCGITGQLAAHAAMSLLTGVPAIRPGRQYVVSLAQLGRSWTAGPDEAHPACPVCRRG